MRWLLISLWLSGLASSVHAHAQERSSLTLADAIAEARGASPALHTARARVTAADTERGVASVIPNPRVTLGSSLNYARFYWTVVFQIPLFGQLDLAGAAADAQADVARADETIASLDVTLAVSLAWIDLWLAEREAEAARDLAARRARSEQIAAERFDAGAAPRLDVVRTHADASRASTDAAARARAVAAARERLLGALGRASEPGAALTTAGDPSLRADVPSLSELEAALDAHPRSQRASGSVRAATAVVEREDRARWPLIGLELGTNDFYAAGNGPDAHVALLFDVPLFDLDAPAVRRAVAQRDVSLAESDTVRRDLVAALRSAHELALAADERARSLLEDVQPAMEEAADLAVASYAEGRLDVFGLIAADQARADTIVEVARATADRGRAMAALAHAAGGLP